MKRLALLLVVLLAGCTPSPPAPSQRTPSPPAPQASPGRPPIVKPAEGANGSTLFGAHWDWDRFAQFEPYLSRLRGSATYYELSWCDIEKTKGNVDWSALDDIAANSVRLGIRLGLKIRIGVCWATGGTAQHVRGQNNKTESAMPLDLNAYKTFVGSVVQRYRVGRGNVTRYAIENEVNAQQYWSGTPSQYEELVRAAAEAIHAADPRAEVLDSGISSVAMGMGIVSRQQGDAAVSAYQRYFARRIETRGKQIPPVSTPAELAAALAHPVNQRNLQYLAVTERLLNEHVVQVRQLHFYEHPDGVPALLDYLKATTPAGMPIAGWEVGRFDKAAAPDETVVADEMTKVTSTLAAGGVTDIVWLPLAYNPGNKAGAEVRAGLLDPDGRDRPAGRMLASLAGAARDATASPIARSGLSGVAFTGKGGTRMVVWSPGSPVRIKLPAKQLTGAAANPDVGAAPVLVETDQTLSKALSSITG